MAWAQNIAPYYILYHGFDGGGKLLQVRIVLLKNAA